MRLNTLYGFKKTQCNLQFGSYYISIAHLLAQRKKETMMTRAHMLEASQPTVVNKPWERQRFSLIDERNVLYTKRPRNSFGLEWMSERSKSQTTVEMTSELPENEGTIHTSVEARPRGDCNPDHKYASHSQVVRRITRSMLKSSVRNEDVGTTVEAEVFSSLALLEPKEGNTNGTCAPAKTIAVFETKKKTIYNPMVLIVSRSISQSQITFHNSQRNDPRPNREDHTISNLQFAGIKPSDKQDQHMATVQKLCEPAEKDLKIEDYSSPSSGMCNFTMFKFSSSPSLQEIKVYLKTLSIAFHQAVAQLYIG